MDTNDNQTMIDKVRKDLENLKFYTVDAFCDILQKHKPYVDKRELVLTPGPLLDAIALEQRILNDYLETNINIYIMKNGDYWCYSLYDPYDPTNVMKVDGNVQKEYKYVVTAYKHQVVNMGELMQILHKKYPSAVIDQDNPSLIRFV